MTRDGGGARGIVALIACIIGFPARRPILTACFSSFFWLLHQEKREILSACFLLFNKNERLKCGSFIFPSENLHIQLSGSGILSKTVFLTFIRVSTKFLTGD